METIYIYNGASRISVPVTDSAERSHSLQQHNYVKLVWKSAENTPISANAYIEYEGQVFYCLDDYFPTHKDGIYEYDIEFHAIEDTFNRPLFFRYVDILNQTTGETNSWKEIEWSLNGNLRTIAEIVVESLNRAYDNAYFALPNDSYADTLLLSYSFASNSIADALSTIAEQNETEWWLEATDEYVDGKRKYILHFDKCELGDTIELNDNYTEDANGVWQSGGLKSVSQSGNTNIIPQKLYVYGSERNIIKKTVEQEVAGGVMNVSYDKKLRLPKRLANNTTIYTLESVGKLLYLNEDSSITISGINNKFEQVKIFDEVYPKMNMTVKGVSVQNPNSENPIYWLKGDRLKSITTENPADDSINPGKLGLLIEGCTLMCTFTSGLLNGREFECSWRESSAEIGLIPIDENDVQIPSGVFKPQEGDTFILWNLAMPQSSIDIAQKELLTEAINYIEELVTSITETDCTTEAEATRISGLNTKIKVGQRISVNSNVFRNGRLLSRIINFSYKLTKPYDISFTLASSRQTGRLATLQNLIADVTHEVHSVGQVQRAISRRQWHDTEEMMSMLDSIQKQMVVVGDENNSFSTTCNVSYNDTNKELFISKGYLQHQSYTDNEWKGAWLIEQDKTISMPALDVKGVTPFYVYFVCSKDNNTGYAEIGSALPQFNDNYVFVLGILSSEFEGKRIFNQSSGLTSIAGGTITTDVVQDPGRRLIIDYANAIIRARQGAQIIGKITFVDDEEKEQSLSKSLGSLLEGVEQAQSEAEQAKIEVEQAKVLANDAYNRDNTNIMLNTKELGFSPAPVAYHYKTMELTEKLKPNTKYVFSVEKSEVTEGVATEFEFCIIKSNYTTKKVTKYIPISSEKKEVAFTTPNTVLGSDVVIIYAGRGGATSNVALKLTKFKLEQGSVATAWTPNPQDIENDVNEALTAVDTIESSVATLNEELTKSLEDGYLSKDEQERLAQLYSQLSEEFTTCLKEYSDVSGSKYIDDATTIDDAWVDFYYAYVDLSDALFELININFDGVFKKDIATEIPSWSYTQYSEYMSLFYEKLDNLKSEFISAREFIRTGQSQEAQRMATDAANAIQIGGVNLVLGTPNQWKQTKALDVIAVGTSYENATNETSDKRITGVSPIAAKGNIYLKFHESGYEASITQFDANKKYIGDDYWISWTNEKAITLHTNTRYIGVTVRTSTNTYISPLNIKSTKLQIEQGTKPTTYKPNDADIIEARTNIVKEGMVRAMLDDDYTEITLTTPLKPNTEYVFSIERCNKNTEVEIYDGDFIPFDGMYVLDAKNDKAVYVTLIPKNATSTINIYTYGQDVTLVGLKLAEGNTYTGYETTPNEKEAVMALQTAMKGTTDIIGGLVMTNLIELKDSQGTVTAGISGLDTDTSFTEEGAKGTFDKSLRFWAGSNLQGSNTAPFRVYNDGRVYGTHFYGFRSATEINASNLSQYESYRGIDLTKTGDLIFLDRSLISGSSTSLANLTVTPINLAFPENVEDYIGSTITIINPEQIPVNIKCGNILNPSIVTLNNCFSTNHSYNEYKNTTLGSAPSAGDYVSRVYQYKVNALGESSSLPLYTYHYWAGTNGTCSINRNMADGWRSNYVIQVYRLVSTPYIDIRLGTPKLIFYGDTITKALTSGTSITYAEYQRAAFWVLEEELIPIT